MLATTVERADLGRALLGCARDAIADALGLAADPVAAGSAGDPAAPEFHALARPGASFVTLTKNASLRGCIGSLQAHRSLGADVRANAIAAALRDPRFLPMRAAEFPGTVIEVSVLGQARVVEARDEAELFTMLRPHEDGVILAWRDRRATFLPQVWNSLPDPAEFLRELKRKAGLDADFWAADLRLSTYRVDKWSESDPSLAPARNDREG